MPGVRAGLAAGAALTLLASAAGLAQADAPGPPAYRTAEDAKTVEGTASSADGPALSAGTTYTDTLGRDEERWYSLELDDASSYFVSATVAPKPGTKVASYGDGITVQLLATDGTECSTEGAASFTGDAGSYPLSDYATRRIGPDLDCQEKGPYTVRVEREGEAGSDPGRWPLELKVMKEPGLTGSIPAEPGEGSWPTQTPAPETGTEPKRKASGGTGFNDAGAVATGVWRDTIAPTETRWYRVPVDWGQRLNVRAELPSSPKDDIGYVSGALGVRVYNTARGIVESEGFESYSGEAAQSGVYSGPALYENRYGDEAPGMRFAGWYYVAVTMGKDMTAVFGESAPLTLRVEVEGKATPGPSYDGDAAAAGFGVSEDDREQAAAGLSDAEASAGGTLRVVGVSGVGVGAALLVGLAAWWFPARRRAAAATGPASAQPAGPVPGTGFGPPPGA